MECEDCKQIYRANDTKQPCPTCGGKGIVLADLTGEFSAVNLPLIHAPNRKERRKAGYYGKRKLEKYLPCPVCRKE